MVDPEQDFGLGKIFNIPQKKKKMSIVKKQNYRGKQRSIKNKNYVCGGLMPLLTLFPGCH